MNEAGWEIYMRNNPELAKNYSLKCIALILCTISVIFFIKAGKEWNRGNISKKICTIYYGISATTLLISSSLIFAMTTGNMFIANSLIAIAFIIIGYDISKYQIYLKETRKSMARIKRRLENL